MKALTYYKTVQKSPKIRGTSIYEVSSGLKTYKAFFNKKKKRKKKERNFLFKGQQIQVGGALSSSLSA